MPAKRALHRVFPLRALAACIVSIPRRDTLAHFAVPARVWLVVAHSRPVPTRRAGDDDHVTRREASPLACCPLEELGGLPACMRGAPFLPAHRERAKLMTPCADSRERLACSVVFTILGLCHCCFPGTTLRCPLTHDHVSGGHGVIAT